MYRNYWSHHWSHKWKIRLVIFFTISLKTPQQEEFFIYPYSLFKLFELDFFTGKEK